jgi:hypothetical protein
MTVPNIAPIGLASAAMAKPAGLIVCTKPPYNTAAVNGRTWHRKASEADDAFRSRVAVEARPAWPDCGVVALLL